MHRLHKRTITCITFFLPRTKHSSALVCFELLFAYFSIINTTKQQAKHVLFVTTAVYHEAAFMLRYEG